MSLHHLLDDTACVSRPRLVALFGVLLGGNALAWVYAGSAFADHPALLGTALLAWLFGLRHAVDADHIAAVDNVVRKLMQEGKRPLLAGLFFSLGHSAVVVLASAAIAVSAAGMQHRFAAWRELGSLIGTGVSAGFLLLIALLNVVTLWGLWGRLRLARSGGAEDAPAVEAMLARRGLLTRLLRPVLRVISRSWHMAPLGVLFGLGFDTATEIGVLGLSAGQAVHGLSLWHVMVFPALFTAGMVLVDCADSVLMVGAYGWALQDPQRKLWYNLVITAGSVAIALVVGGVEVAGLLAQRLPDAGMLAGAARWSGNLTPAGYGIMAAFLLAWGVSAGWQRWRRRRPEAATVSAK